jgi:hypothetical protein
MQWDVANKQLVPLERHAADEILKDFPRDKIGEETHIHHINARDGGSDRTCDIAWFKT